MTPEHLRFATKTELEADEKVEDTLKSVQAAKDLLEAAEATAAGSRIAEERDAHAHRRERVVVQNCERRRGAHQVVRLHLDAVRTRRTPDCPASRLLDEFQQGHLGIVQLGLRLEAGQARAAARLKHCAVRGAPLRPTGALGTQASEEFLEYHTVEYLGAMTHI